MIKPEVPLNEAERIAALKSYSILDTLPEEDYDNITFLASHICGTPISLISLIDDNRQWFKSHYGLDATETARELAFCAHAINNLNDMLIVPDARHDIRFHDNPLVVGNPHVIFYAGVPLINPEGYPLGTLCVIDHQASELNEEQQEALRSLAHQVIQLLELRRKNMALESKVAELEIKNQGLERFARVAAHDIKSPLSTIFMMIDIFESKYTKKLNNEEQELLSRIKSSSLILSNLIDGILKYSKNAQLLSEGKEEIDIKKLIETIIGLLNPNKDAEITVNTDPSLMIYSNRIALEQIILNLVSNAIKYNDKEKAKIAIDVSHQNDKMYFSICDNGPGIKADDKERIFKPFEIATSADKYGHKGSGLGLATVKLLVEGLGGTIDVTSNEQCSSIFEFNIKMK